MNSYRNTSIIVAVLFIIATITSLLTTVFLGSTLTSTNYLTTISANANQVITAAMLLLISAVSILGIAVMMFPILKKHIESLAIWYVGIRTIEAVFTIVAALILLSLLTLSQQYVSGAFNASYYQPLGNLLLALNNRWDFYIEPFIFAFGSLALNYSLYQTKLVPRFLSVWGLIGAALVLIYGLLGLLDLNTSILSILELIALPIAVQEMVFAVWLIVKGFNPSVIASYSDKTNAK